MKEINPLYKSLLNLSEFLSDEIAILKKNNFYGKVIFCAIHNLFTLKSFYEAGFVEEILNDTYKVLEEVTKANNYPNFKIIFNIDKFVIFIHEKQESDVSPLIEDIRQRTKSVCINKIHSAYINIRFLTFSFEGKNIDEETIINKLLSLKSEPTLLYKPYLDVNIHLPDLEERFKKNYKDAVDLNYALINKKFTFAFQPIINAKTRKVSFYECLFRILDENNNPRSIGPMINSIENLGYIDLLDEIVVEMITEELKNSTDEIFSINISKMAIFNNNVINKFRKNFTGNDYAKRLIVEITENVIAYDIKDLQNFTEELKKLGCKIAIDDFGSGNNTSFKELEILKFDIIKIDGSYIKNIFNNPSDLIFVEAVLKFASHNHAQVVAEYVDNAAIADYLENLGATFLQGNYFSEAIIHRK